MNYKIALELATFLHERLPARPFDPYCYSANDLYEAVGQFIDAHLRYFSYEEFVDVCEKGRGPHNDH